MQNWKSIHGNFTLLKNVVIKVFSLEYTYYFWDNLLENKLEGKCLTMDQSINELKKIVEDEPKEKKKPSPQKWAGFIESTVVNFFDEHNIEKLSIEDGNGNKAKLARTKDNGIKIEYSSTVLM